MTRPSFLVDTATVPEEDGAYPHSSERLSYGREIGHAAGLRRIGLHLERVPPGRRTSYPHAHADEEEFVYVLEGEIDAWIDGTLHRMRAGDLAGFPAGTGVCHTFLNNGDADALLLVGGERSALEHRIHYPLHPERRAQRPPGTWWDDPPVHRQGDHDGRPGCRLGAAARAWVEELIAGGLARDLGRLTAWAFGDSPDQADELGALVVAGTKRATASALWGYEPSRVPVEAPGDQVVVTRWDGTPLALIELTRVDIVRFSDVDAGFAADEGEGEGDGSLAGWRAAHEACFRRECARLGRDFSPELPVVCLRFRVLAVA